MINRTRSYTNAMRGYIYIFVTAVYPRLFYQVFYRATTHSIYVLMYNIMIDDHTFRVYILYLYVYMCVF